MSFFHKSYPEIISLHIPKTAGTSFRNILKSVYGDDQVVRFDINQGGVIRVNEQFYTKQHLPHVKVIHGHFFYQSLFDYFDLPENYKMITWVRDPVKRVISNFYYLESRLKEILNEEKKNLDILSKIQRTLIEYARSDKNRNRQTKFLEGSQLEKFDFIGIHEYFDQEVERLSKVLNWRNVPEILYHNKTEKSRQPFISDEVINEIRELNNDDVQLYSEALQIRHNKMIR